MVRRPASALAVLLLALASCSGNCKNGVSETPPEEDSKPPEEDSKPLESEFDECTPEYAYIDLNSGDGWADRWTLHGEDEVKEMIIDLQTHPKVVSRKRYAPDEYKPWANDAIIVLYCCEKKKLAYLIFWRDDDYRHSYERLHSFFNEYKLEETTTSAGYDATGSYEPAPWMELISLRDRTSP